jgi:hypothetical protein
MFFGLVFYEIIIVYKTEFREFTLFLFYGGMFFKHFVYFKLVFMI